MQNLIFSYFITFLLFYIPLVYAFESYDYAIYNTSNYIIMELHKLKKLENRKIAIFGFQDLKSGKGCKSLTSSIADKISSSFHKFKQMVNFHIVARRDIKAIEDEILISNGSLSGNIMNFLAPSDIFITGTWLDGKDSLILNIKAFEIAKNATNELISKQAVVDKKEMLEFFSDCLKMNYKNIENKKKENVIVVYKDSKKITIQVNGMSPPECSVTCKKSTAVKNNKRLALNYLSKLLNKNIDNSKLNLDKIEYNTNYSAISIYTYMY